MIAVHAPVPKCTISSLLLLSIVSRRYSEIKDGNDIIRPCIKSCCPGACPYKYNVTRPEENGWHFENDIFKWSFINEMFELRVHLYWNTLWLSNWQYANINMAITSTNIDQDQWQHMAALRFHELTDQLVKIW